MKLLDVIKEQDDNIFSNMLNDLSVKSSTPQKKEIKPTPKKNISLDNGKYDAILIGGCDDRKDEKGNLIDKPLPEQITILQNASGLKNIKGFRYKGVPDNEIISFVEDHPDLPVVLFSAGCQKAHLVLRSKGVNPNKVFLIQPWAKSQNRLDYYNGLTIPKKHIYVGKSASAGNGISGATRCPEGMGHWESLPAIGGMVLKLR